MIASAPPSVDERLLSPRSVRLLLWVGLALLLALFHASRVEFGGAADQLERHERILAGAGQSPWGYRVLSPLLAEVAAAPLEAAGLPRSAAVRGAYVASRFAWTLALLVLFRRYLAHWFASPWPLAGTLLLAALHPPSFAWYWFAPDSPLDLAIWAAVAVATVERHDRWLLPLVLLGALNRETVVFAAGVHAALRYGEEPWPRLARRTAALLLAWAVPFVGLRLLLGPLEWSGGGTVGRYLAANFGGPSWPAWAAALWGVAWILPLLTWRSLPRPWRRLLLVFVPYVLLQFLFGRIREVRLFLPLALVLVPVLLRGLGAAVRRPGICGPLRELV
ncbi:MAG: hypothetical protein KBD01_09760 [Acidobacteria bacterium]|nr:hypothetical protein [Acidobacteriota bacterium]